ncbi:proline/serine-rich coiled-coil protein 1-like isoform X2 [Chiloscyllium plagiosum]|uniref:proline/serine-rich coiled-coil protein 1-like isoform X2 n=2 Tax=Chiloscyllium plagiosum TaxID=36176 RepID=UPI001CB8634A|nr:proline/serine-rich coiled-coil protein 1-like isoform X2 [Chiloscyllium plagiosum]
MPRNAGARVGPTKLGKKKPLNLLETYNLTTMNLAADDDSNFITEETLDFAIGFPSESQESLLENDPEEVLIAPVKHSERCVAMGIDVNYNNGNQQKTNEAVLKWSPLSAEKLVEIVKEANRLANQFEKCALKEKENAKIQGREDRSCNDRSKLEKESKAKIRLLQDDRTCKKSPRSPRRDTFFVLDSPNKALLPSVNLQVINENSPITNTGHAHSIEHEISNSRIGLTSESERITTTKPMQTKEGNLSTEIKQAAVKKQSMLSKPSGLKLPSGFNRKGNMHSLSPSKPYQYSKKDSLHAPLSSTGSLKQTKGASLNNPENRSGKSTVLHNKQSREKASMISEANMHCSSISFKLSADTNMKLLPSANKASNKEINEIQPPSKIPPVNRLRPGSVPSIRTGNKNERASSAVLKGKVSERQYKTTVTSTKHLSSTTYTSASQIRSQPKKTTSSNVVKRFISI